MGNGKATPETSSDSSSEETIEVEELPPTNPTAGTTPKSAARPKEVKEVASESSEEDYRPRGPPAARHSKAEESPPRASGSGHGQTPGLRPVRPRTPERPPKGKGKGGKGKDKGKGRTECPYCYTLVSNTSEAAIEQHQRWNRTCLTWQFRGLGHNWAAATQLAANVVEGWEPVEDMPEGKAARPHHGAPRPDVKRSRDVAPAGDGHGHHRSRDVAPAGGGHGHHHSRDVAPAGGGHRRCRHRTEKKVKKEKKDKKVRPRSVTPEVPRRGKGRSPPSGSSGDERAPKVLSRHGRTLVLRLPR